MPTLWKALSSSSSSSSPLKGKSKSSNDIYKNTANQQEQKRKLTRARKLRHATDDELGLKSTAVDAGPQSLPVSPVSSSSYGSGARTPGPACGGHWSKSAVPQPLPRPEMNYQQTLSDCSHGPASSATRVSEQTYPNHSHQVLGKTTDDIINKSNPYPTYRRRGFPQELNLDDDFHLHFPTRSAPNSGFSSPVLSPQRYSTVDLFHPSPNLEFSNSDRISKSYQISPLHSPTKHGTSRGVSVHSHNKSLPGDTNSANVHPLPRPPVVSRPSPTIRHSFDISDVSSSVKGQWQRGRPIGRGTYGSVYFATHRYCNRDYFDLKALRLDFSSDSETGATCAVKEVEMIPDDPKCGECVKQLEQLRDLVLVGSFYDRDIKGANLLVDASGVVKLADFGLAKHLNGHDIDLSLKGTPHWMAPEAVMRKDANPDLAYGVDIWSVGCTVIEMLTGKPPWSEFTSVQAMFNVLNRSPPIPETLSAEGKDFLQQCFQRRPEDRPSAVKLLEHPFVRSSRDQIVAAGFVQEFSGMKLHDVEGTSDWTRRNKDVMPFSSVNRIQQGKSPLLNG
ncbi:mitogen-activated protein kinase kinase kinase yoda [Phtheirospermum japonicum]|uniref:Mitogen-activated protein kinase kinase kinase yoda n=1 Tax=Phtheirospermum japonicum TaxID=374723 RepID=A0A830CE81_9LAMI|nr:mitogen-activated protein kinase kinase kinase yoda [Phtheirospermum japonicum]